MANIEDILRKETYKEPGTTVDERVFNTLYGAQQPTPTSPERLQLHRTSKAVALLVKRLGLSEKELDDFLLDVVR